MALGLADFLLPPLAPRLETTMPQQDACPMLQARNCSLLVSAAAQMRLDPSTTTGVWIDVPELLRHACLCLGPFQPSLSIRMLEPSLLKTRYSFTYHLP